MGPLSRFGPANILLALILLAFTVGQAAATLLSSGLPLNHDEANFVIEALRLPAQGRLTGYVHGPLLYELLALVEVVWYLASRAIGHTSSAVDHLANLLASLGPHLQVARLVCLAAGVLCLVQLYRVARIFAGPSAGLLTVILAATNLTFAVFTTTVKEDVFYWLLLLTAMDLVWRSDPQRQQPEPPARRRFPQSSVLPLLAGAAIGASFSAKYFGLLGMSLVIVPLIRARGREARRRAVAQVAWLCVGAATAVLLLFPFLLFDLPSVLHSLRYMSSATSAGASGLALGPYLGVHLPWLVGPVVGIAALAELVVRGKTDPRGPQWLLVPCAVLLVFLCARRGHTMAYYIYPVALGAFVLAAAFAARLGQRLAPPWRALPPAALVASALLGPSHLPSTLKYALLLTGPDTRAVTAAHLQRVVPAGDCIMATGGIAGWNQFGPPLAPLTVQSANPSGTYAAAERLALQRRPEPRHDFRLVERYRLPAAIPADCDWLVEGRIGPESTVEMGPVTAEPPPPVAPPGFTTVWRLDAIPPIHSRLYPYMTVLDFEEIRALSISRLWRERSLGSSFFVHRRERSSAGQ